MKYYVQYDATGKIGLWGTIQDVDFPQLADGGNQVLEGYAHGDTHYVYNGQITPRPLMDTHPTIISKTDNVAENEVITITGVPAGADIWVDGEKYNLAAGETVLELTFDTVGTYRIRIVSFPYQDWERTVTVV